MCVCVCVCLCVFVGACVFSPLLMCITSLNVNVIPLVDI